MSVLRRRGRGDMYVQIVVETPVNLPNAAGAAARVRQAGKARKTSPETEGFFAKVKELWEDLRE